MKCNLCGNHIDLNGLNPKNFKYRENLYHYGCFRIVQQEERADRLLFLENAGVTEYWRYDS